MSRLRKLFTVILLSVILFSFHSIKADAISYASRFAWRDDAGNIILKTEDHHRTSSVCYDTMGFTVTRCVLGTMEPVEEQYITIRFNDLTVEDVPIGNGYTTSAFKVTESELLSKIAATSGDWLADIQSGETCYLRFDAIMVTIDYNLPLERQYSGAMRSDNNQDYVRNLSNPIPGVYDKFNYEDLKYHTYGWASPESIETHYNIYLLYNGGKEAEPVVSDEFVKRTGKDKPEYWTWNNSDEFDLSKGIPSGENITNGYGADKWYGNYTIGKHEVEREYILSYDLIYHVYNTTYLTDDSGNYILDGNGDKIENGTTDDIHHVPMVFKVKRKASYYYCLGINLYELTEADIYNSVYPGDQIKYTSAFGQVSMDVELDGESNPSVVDNWETDEDAHIIWPDPYTDTIEIDCGEGAGSVIEMQTHLNEVLYDDVITDEDYIKEVTSWNDLVEVNNVKYMDNEHVSHANDTSKVRIEFKDMTNGKDDDMYLFERPGMSAGQVTVKIPEDVANGSYATAMDVIYKRRSLADEYIMAFSTYDQGESIYNHIKPGYEKNEPVYVHTPVISPVDIPDSEDQTQLITENKTQHVGMVDKDGRTSDGKAIHELILDNEYTIHFDPAMHRDIQGYGWSGDPSKYDKYVKGKYVAFPFTAQVQMDGRYSEFYAVDDSTVDEEGKEKLPGYTKWIEVDNNETKFYIPPWAIENEYYEIQFRVEAYNVFDESGVDHGDEKEGTANDSLNENGEAINYVATYVVPVELSGIIYDFEIIGVRDRDTFYRDEMTDSARSSIADWDVPLAPKKEEKKQGNLNRLGEPDVRYTLDGELTNDWLPENTLPLAMGVSNISSAEGYLKQNTTFTFSVKTIANLWDEGIDSIHITPSFTYVDHEGNKNKEIQVYYWDEENNTLVRYGYPESADRYRETNFWNISYAGSLWDSEYEPDNKKSNILTTAESDYDGDYHDPDLLYTIEKHNALTGDDWKIGRLLGQTSLSYRLSEIILNSQMRTLSGKYEELARNSDNARNHLETFRLDAETADKMRYSMQTWYGEYYIPANLMVCEKDFFKNLGGTDMDGDGEVDLWEYMYETSKSMREVEEENPDMWLGRGTPAGYLILNFDITTVNDGKEHLSYHGGSNDMWQTQGAKETAKLGDPNLETGSEGKYPVIDVPLESGDVAFVNLNETQWEGRTGGFDVIN